jgi:hypothetical protein
MTDSRKKPAAGSPEFFAARQIASELMLRALFQMHPNKDLVNTYLDRMLGQTLAQPFFLQNLGSADLVKETLENMRVPAPQYPPEGL